MATASTVGAALATIEAADRAASVTELPVLLLPALADLTGADSAVWTELATRPGGDPLPSRVVAYPEALITEETTRAFEQHASAFPLARHTRPGGDGRPARRSDLQSLRSFRDSGMYADVARQAGVDQILATALPAGGLHVCLALNRAGRDFTPTAVDVLTRLRPLLTRRVARLAEAAPSREATVPPLTSRQEQVLRLVADGLTDAAIGRRLDCSPRTVDKHLEHIYRRLGVSSRTAAIAAARAVPAG